MCPDCECVLASSGRGCFWKCVQGVSVFWLLLASCMADNAPPEMCPGCEYVLASSGRLHGWWGSFWNVSRMWVCSGFFWQAAWLMRLLKMCPGSECVLASSAKLHGWWGCFWKCVQGVSVSWLLLPSCMADKPPPENVSRMWVCSGFFWQAAWPMRLLLKMCPESECVLASAGRLHGW